MPELRLGARVRERGRQRRSKLRADNAFIYLWMVMNKYPNYISFQAIHLLNGAQSIPQHAAEHRNISLSKISYAFYALVVSRMYYIVRGRPYCEPFI